MKSLRRLFTAGMGLAIAGCSHIQPVTMRYVPEEPVPRTLEQVITEDYAVRLEGNFTEEELVAMQYALDAYLGVIDYRQIGGTDLILQKRQPFLTLQERTEITSDVEQSIASLQRRHLSYRRQLEPVLNRYGLGEYRFERHDTSSEQSIRSAYEALGRLLVGKRTTFRLGYLQAPAECVDIITLVPLDNVLEYGNDFPWSPRSYQAIVVHEMTHAFTLDPDLSHATAPLLTDFRQIDGEVDDRKKKDPAFDVRVGYVSDYAHFQDDLPRLQEDYNRVQNMEYIEPALETIIRLASQRNDPHALKLARNYLGVLEEYHHLQQEVATFLASTVKTVTIEVEKKWEDLAETGQYYVLGEDSGIVVDQEQWSEPYIPAKLAAFDRFFDALRCWNSHLPEPSREASPFLEFDSKPAVLYTTEGRIETSTLNTSK
ncbi:hypothetical protein HYW21_01005 [Candidatus Woesearchaeota archaeon]|nr:hypothetical protein [Candidatus Woesearchaeota archaeon]